MSSLHVILHVIEMSHQCMRITKANLIHVSLVININKGTSQTLQGPQDKICSTQTLLKNLMMQYFNGQFQHDNAKYGA